MGRASDILIPTRFLLTVGHFVVVLLAYFNKDANVAASLGSDPTATEVTAAGDSLFAALSLSIVCLTINFLGLFGGFTLFFDKLNCFHMIFHFFGGVLTAWYIVDIWSAANYWWIWGLFSLLPALAELMALSSIFLFKMHKY